MFVFSKRFSTEGLIPEEQKLWQRHLFFACNVTLGGVCVCISGGDGGRDRGNFFFTKARGENSVGANNASAAVASHRLARHATGK